MVVLVAEASTLPDVVLFFVAAAAELQFASVFTCSSCFPDVKEAIIPTLKKLQLLHYTWNLLPLKHRTRSKVSGGRSTLNPDALLFIPAAYKQVEDFSLEWWQLVTTTTWYKDYWISQHQNEEALYNNAQDEDGFERKDVAGLLPDTFDLDVGVDFSAFESQFEDLVDSHEAEAEKRTTPQTLPSYSNGYARANAMRAVKPSFRC
ncbi:Protein EARLY RESPONSIVE TO DEHYDRATION 15 [Linum perenne]